MIKFYKETNFKETLIGKIPRDWHSVKLREVAEVRGNKNISGFEKVAFIPMELISETKIYANYQVKAKDEIKSYIYCEAGDILLAKITPSLENGKQGIVPFDIPNGIALATTEVFPIRCREIDRFFLFYILKFPKFRNKIIASMTGTTGRQRASKESVENLDIPFPPVLEQRAIAEVLSVVDLAIQRTDEIIAKTERLKKGLMQTLLTRGIGHKEYKETPIGKIPKTWQVVTLQEIAEINKEQIDPAKSIPNETFIYIDIDSVENETGRIRNPKRILGRDAPSRARRVVHENDVIMSTVRPYLKAFAIIPKEYDGQICSTGFAVLSCKKDKVIPYFLLITLFSENVIKQCNQMMMGGQYPALNQSQVSRIKIPLPPRDEQEKIASIFYTLDEKLELERIEKKKLEMIKQGLMDLLLTGKVRVKVD